MQTKHSSWAFVGVFALTLLLGNVAGPVVRPVVQSIFVRLGQGNEQVVLGEGGWMYFRPALEHLQRPLSKAPLPAISHFREQLLLAGIELVVVPIPVKASIDDEGLGLSENPMPPGWEAFLLDLKRYRVPIVDAYEVLSERTGPQYLMTDTHWRPEAMDAVALAIADRLRRMGLPQRRRLVRSGKPVDGHGDLVDLLGAGVDIPSEQVTSWSVDDFPSDTLGAPVLLIGDSFANIYADASLGFGAGAGLQEAISHHLGSPVDALIQNDGGASKTRVALQDDLGRLSDTLVVVWVFSARELSLGEWIKTPLDLDAPAQTDSPFLELAAGEQIDFTGVILDISDVPDPRRATYADHVVTLQVRGDDGRQGFVRGWSMRDRKLTPLASKAVGSVYRATLIPWDDAASSARSASRSELDTRPRGAPVCWGSP